MRNHGEVGSRDVTYESIDIGGDILSLCSSHSLTFSFSAWVKLTKVPLTMAPSNKDAFCVRCDVTVVVVEYSTRCFEMVTESSFRADEAEDECSMRK